MSKITAGKVAKKIRRQRHHEIPDFVQLINRMDDDDKEAVLKLEEEFYDIAGLLDALDDEEPGPDPRLQEARARLFESAMWAHAYVCEMPVFERG